MAQKSRTEFRLECYSPIVTPGMAIYYNDDWAMFPVPREENRFIREYHNIGFSSSFIRHFSKFNAGMRIGFVTRKIDELADYTSSGDNTFQSFSFSQKHTMGSVFIQRTEDIKFLQLQLGLEMPYIHYGSAESIIQESMVNYEDGKIWSEGSGIYTSTAGAGFGTGLGINLGLACRLNKKMSLGIELNQYLLYTEFSKPVTTVSNSEMTWHYPESTTKYNRNYSQIVTLKQTVFSKSSLRVYYAVKF